MKARIAAPADCAGIVDLLTEMHDENALVSADWVSVAETVRRLVEGESVYVTEDELGITGSIGLFVSSFWYSPEKYLTDRWTYVRKSARKSRAIYRLLEAAEATSERLRLPLMLGVTSPVDTDRKIDFYRRRYRQVGGIFTRK